MISRRVTYPAVDDTGAAAERPPCIFDPSSHYLHVNDFLTLIMKIKSNTSNNDLPWRFGLYLIETETSR